MSGKESKDNRQEAVDSPNVDIGDGIRELLQPSIDRKVQAEYDVLAEKLDNRDKSPEELMTDYRQSMFSQPGDPYLEKKLDEIENQKIPEPDEKKMREKILEEERQKRYQEAVKRHKEHYGRHPKNHLHEMAEEMQLKTKYEMSGKDLRPVIIDENGDVIERGRPEHDVSERKTKKSKGDWVKTDHWINLTESGKAIMMKFYGKRHYAPVSRLLGLIGGEEDKLSFSRLVKDSFQPTDITITRTESGKAIVIGEDKNPFYAPVEQLQRLINKEIKGMRVSSRN